MRVLQLRLIAFGAFADRELDFSAQPDALTVVYGSNEAGKSTTLRALEGLLFGIDSTQDAHKHAAKSLRVGGTIETASGQILKVVRRRGVKGTLRDEADQVQLGSEETLQRALGGVDRELFRTLYGLDHERLREGARALLAQKSSLAESLFEAGLAGAGVARLLISLRADSEAIFAPRATARPLNHELREFANQTKQARTYTTQVSKFEVQVAAVKDAAEKKARAEDELRALERTRRRLERARRVAPLVGARRAALAQRDALGDVIALPEGSTAEREAALAQRAEAASVAAAATMRLEEISLEIEAWAAERLDGIDPAQAFQDLSRHLAESRNDEQRRELASEREQLAPIAALPNRWTALVDDGRALLELVSRRDAARNARAAARAELAQTQSKLARARTEQGALSGTSGAAAESAEIIAIHVQRAERILGAERERAAAKSRAAELAAMADVAFSALGSAASRDEMRAAAGPSPEEITEWIRAFDEAHSEITSLDTRLVDLGQQRAALMSERATVLADGEVATAAELEQARRLRDTEIVSLHEAGDRSEALARTLGAVRRADSLADRMLVDAQRAARLRVIAASVEEAETKWRATAAAREKAIDHARELRAANAARMAAAGGSRVEDPRKLDAFWRRRRAFIEADRVAHLARDASRALENEATEATRALAISLAMEPTDLAALVARGRVTLTQYERARADHERVAAKLEEHIDTEARDLQRLELAEDAATLAETEAMRALEHAGLDPDLGRDQLASALQRGREVEDARARVQKIDAQIARFAESEAQLATYCSNIFRLLGRDDQDADLPASLRGDRLLAELKRADAAAKELSQRETERRAQAEKLRDALERKRVAEATLSALVARANVSAVEELPAAEARSQRARTLDADLTRIEAQIRAAAGDGASLADVESELSTIVLDDADAEQDRLDAERDELERAKERAAHERAGIELALGTFEESRAADYAEQAQVHLAKARGLVLKYARLRLASVLLEKEIDRYRRMHQGPVLTRAEQHFARLTGNSFDELRVVIDERNAPELVCVRGGQEIAIDGLSDGAKDQLFLALRLATIERHAAREERLPLVLDDVLVNFDEDRARAALEVLADLTPRPGHDGMQVILFTHQERIVELARALPKPAQIVTL